MTTSSPDEDAAPLKQPKAVAAKDVPLKQPKAVVANNEAVRPGEEAHVELVELAEVDLTYTALESVSYGPDGQLYGTMEGRVRGDRLSGDLRLTNLAARRVDNVNLPTLRGLLTTEDQAMVWVELDGIATLRQPDDARVFVTTFRCRTGADEYAWLNTVFGVLEGVLDSVGVGGVARGRLYACQPTVT